MIPESDEDKETLRRSLDLRLFGTIITTEDIKELDKRQSIVDRLSEIFIDPNLTKYSPKSLYNFNRYRHN